MASEPAPPLSAAARVTANTAPHLSDRLVQASSPQPPFSLTSAATHVRPRRLPLGGSPRRLSYERRLRLWLTVLALPPIVLGFALSYQSSRSWIMASGVALCLLVAWSFAALYLFDQLVRPLQTLSNVVAALREDDFSFRARGGRRGDSLGDLALEINALASTLQVQRASARDALALLERVIGSMPGPVLAFGPDRRLRLLNRAAEQVFQLSPRFSIGKTSADLDLDGVLNLPDEAVFAHRQRTRSDIPSSAPVEGDGSAALLEFNRWSVRSTLFRLNGVPHTLLVLSDVAAALREEERTAWQRLVRVLSHEINNSLTPIQSIAGSLRGRLDHALTEGPAVSSPSQPSHLVSDHDPALTSDAERGLRIIEERAGSLNRFLQAYQQLTRLPTPRLQRISLSHLIAKVVALETRVSVVVVPGPAVDLDVDPDQLQQLLINLLRNAAEAALSTQPGQAISPAPMPDSNSATMSQPEPATASVGLTWTTIASEISLQISDSGPGLTNQANLFVPFYTTKPNGSGIGLALARQIAAAHRSSLTLRNREDGYTGCIAELRVPRSVLQSDAKQI